MNKQPHQGFSTFISKDIVNIAVYHQYQVFLNSVKLIPSDNNILLHYPSDDVLLLKDIDKEILEKIKKDKKILVWELCPHTGDIMETYHAEI